MTTYRLDNLSPKAFEQLTQALADNIFGRGLVVFGDGPDGGREAAFNGTVTLPGRAQPVHGYFVLQTKFKPKPLFDQRDTSWLKDQLRNEFKEYETRADRTRPDQYLICTNVILSGLPKKGGKDDIFYFVQHWASFLGIKDFEIWDHDKICALLDQYPYIRQSYTAWITPSDVLTRLLAAVSDKSTRLPEVLQKFAQNEFLQDTYARLEQAGHSSGQRTSLAKVFVDLPVSAKFKPTPENYIFPAENTKIVEYLLTDGDQKLTPQSEPAEKDPAQQLSPYKGRHVIIGGPGQGKTTVSQFVAQLYRARALYSHSDAVLLPSVKSALKELNDQMEHEDIALPNVQRIPFRVSLSKFADFLHKKYPEPVTLIDYIRDHINQITNEEITKDDTRTVLNTAPIVLILDGLDEVPTTSNRQAVMDMVSQFLVDARHCRADLQVIATTRPQGYNDDFAPTVFAHHELEELDTEAALHYATRLANARYAVDTDRRSIVKERLAEAIEDEATRRLTRTPLQITILCALVDQIGEAPRERWKLFREYYEVITKREIERGIPASQIIRDFRSDIDAIHERVGILLQVLSEQRGATEAALTTPQLKEIIRKRLAEQGHEGEALQHLTDQMLAAASERLVFIVGLEADRAGFEIRSLQEFMAAEALCNASDEKLKERFTWILKSTHWENVALFIVGHIFGSRERLRDAVVSTIQYYNTTFSKADSTLKSGSLFALSVLEDRIAHQQPLYFRTLAREALALMATHRRFDHARFGYVYDERMYEDYRNALAQARGQPKTHHRLNWQLVLYALCDRQVSWASDEVRRVSEDTNMRPSDVLLKMVDRQLARSDVFFRPSFQAHLKEVLPKTELKRLTRLLHIITPRNSADEYGWERALQATMREAFSSKFFEAYFLPDALPNEVTNATDVFITSVDAPLKRSFEEARSRMPQWENLRPLYNAVEFRAEPSRETLGEVLASVVEVCDTEDIEDLRAVVGMVSGIASWPLQTILEACSTFDDLRRAHAANSGGKFGDLESWRKAERRWRSEGILLEDLYHRGSAEFGIDEKIGEVGVSYIRDIDVRVDNRILNRILPLVEEQASTVEGNWAFRDLYRLAQGSVRDQAFLDEDWERDDLIIRMLCHNSGRTGKIFTDDLQAVGNFDAAYDRNRDLVDKALKNASGIVSPGFAPYQGEHRLSDLTKQLERIVRREGLKCEVVRILAAMRGASEIRIDVSLADVQTETDARKSFALLAILCQSDRLDKEDAADVASSVLTKWKQLQHPGGFMHIVEALQGGRASRAQRESVLLEILNFDKDLGDNIALTVFSALERLTEQRNSGLGDIRNWHVLGLPEVGIEDSLLR